MRQNGRLGVVTVVFLSIVLLLSACGGSSSSSNNSESADYDSGTSDRQRASFGLSNQDGSESTQEKSEVAMDNAPSDSEKSSEMDEAANVLSGGDYERRIIREQYIEQQVQDLKEVIEEIERSANAISGAYIESLQEWKNEGRNHTEHRARLVLRIPIDQFNAFLRNVEEQGKVINRQLTGQDVTEEFVDNASRLRNLITHEDRILKLYEKANTIEEMLKIESELSRIRSSIEQLEGRQKFLNHVTSTAMLSLELFQVDEEELIKSNEDTSLFTEAWIGFKESIRKLSLLGERSFIQLITLLPYLVILALFSTLLFIAVRKMKFSKTPSDQSEKKDKIE